MRYFKKEKFEKCSPHRRGPARMFYRTPLWLSTGLPHCGEKDTFLDEYFRIGIGLIMLRIECNTMGDIQMLDSRQKHYKHLLHLLQLYRGSYYNSPVSGCLLISALNYLR